MRSSNARFHSGRHDRHSRHRRRGWNTRPSKIGALVTEAEAAFAQVENLKPWERFASISARCLVNRGPQTEAGDESVDELHPRDA